MATDHETLVHYKDIKSGFNGFVSIHNTQLGPSSGGTRVWSYATEHDALNDALALSRAMTYKSALSGLSLGGGKAAIVGTPDVKTEAWFEAYGNLLNMLDGKFNTGCDVGFDLNDTIALSRYTEHVSGLPLEMGGSGDSAPMTAYGLKVALETCVRFKHEADSLAGFTFAVQGYGKVASNLCDILVSSGVDPNDITVSDIDTDKIKVAHGKGFHIVDPGAILKMSSDVLAPCALGGVIDADVINQLSPRTKIVCGAANNPLVDPLNTAMLMRSKDIIYGVDFLVNSGGIRNIASEIGRPYDIEYATKLTNGIEPMLRGILEISHDSGRSTLDLAYEIADDMIKRTLELKS